MKGEKPDLEVYAVDDSGKKDAADKAFWTRIGSAWTGKASITVKLRALPVNGRLVLLKPKPKEAQAKMDPFQGKGG